MPYTDQQIRDYATQLQAKGASSNEIEQFVKLASQDRVGANGFAPSTSPFNPNTPNSQFTQPTPAGATKMQYSPTDNTSVVGNLPGFLAGAKAKQGIDVIKGAVKGAAHTLTSIGAVAAQHQADQARFLGTPQAAPSQEQINTIMPDAHKVFAPSNTSQKVGYGAEQAAEYLVPGGAEADATKAVAGALDNAPKIVQTVGKFGAKALASGGSMAAVTAAQGGSAGDVKKAGLIGAALPAVGAALKVGGKALAESVIPTTAKEAPLIQAYKANTPFWKRVLTGAESAAPTTAASTAFDKGLVGTESMIGVQAKRASSNLWDKLISPALKNSTEQVDMPTFFKQVEQQIIKDNPELSRQKDLLNALNAMKEDYAGVGKVSLDNLQKFKEGWAQFVPEKAYKGLPIAGAFNDVKDKAADVARQMIYKALGPDVKQAYFDYGNLKGLQELGQKAMTGGKLKGGFGSFWSAVKDMALVPTGTVGGQTVYKVGRGVEMFGKPGAKTVKDLISPPQ